MKMSHNEEEDLHDQKRKKQMVCMSDEDEDSDEDDEMRDQSHSAPFSSENEAQGGDPAVWQCAPPASTSPSAETPAHPPSSQFVSGPRSRPTSQSPTAPPSDLTGTKKRTSNSTHMRRNIRKLLREHQLDAVTKAAQQEELQRRRRLDEQRQLDFSGPLLPEYSNDVAPQVVSSNSASTGQDSKSAGQEVICVNSSRIGISKYECKIETPSASAATDQTHKPVVEDLSSGEDDSVTHISSESTNDKEEVELSGAHTNDLQNRPDAEGRVLVNLNHPTSEQDIFLAPQLARAVKPHQIGGIRFLYDNLVESVERFSSSGGFGCILAHSMGLGKTLQVISFIDILFSHTSAHTVLAIVPVNTLQNWLSEFNTWVPPPETLSADADSSVLTPRRFKVHILNDEHKNTVARAKVVEDWARDGGVLLMGYEMYRLLSMKKTFVAGRKKRNKKTSAPDAIDVDEEDKQQELLKGVEKALARPGPDVVICDEGHRIKNCHASTSQALKNIQTRRRVVLTGYPLQNNLIEYWCMVDFVRPDFLGSRQEFSNMFERPILNGQCVDSTPQDVQLMRYRSHVLHSLLEGFVQRRGHDVLRDQLPSKEEHVILVRLCPLQRALYTEFMNRFREAGNTGWLSLNPLKAFCVCCKIWNHPDVLYEALQKENLPTEQDLDLDDITSAGNTRCSTAPNQKSKNVENSNPIGGLSLNQLQEKANQVITYEWAKELMCGYQPGILENSAKMVLLFHLIEESIRQGDKILVFSQSLSTLTVIEDFLAKRPVPQSPYSPSGDNPNQNWIRNVNYYRLDGSTTASERERLINQFNDPSNTSAWVFLLSTRAGCLGVNLIGANRVVVFDASWNPCHDAQAVCRVYRYGQRKACHIYRLVCDFTLEKKIYDRQISKQGMSDRVVDDLNPVLTFTRREVESLLHFVEEELDPSQVQLQAEDGTDSVLQKALELYSHLITKQPFPHESLLIDRRELKLSTAEKKAAKKSYEEEKRASVPYTRPSYAHYYPASDQSLTNIPAFSQRNWRPSTGPDEKPVVSARPAQLTVGSAMPRQASANTGSNSNSSKSNPGSFPMNCLQKAGVFVQKIVTTTDIVIPGTNSSKDVQARITAGESIHVIRGTKGTYIRTSDGRIFAIRAANKAKMLPESATLSPGEVDDAAQDVPPDSSNGCVSPARETPAPSKVLTGPFSPDSPEILSELQRYTGASKVDAPGSSNSLPPSKLPQAILSRCGDGFARGSKISHNLSAPNQIQPSEEAMVAQDLRIGSKRKASPSSLDERLCKQPAVTRHSSASPPSHGFPYAGGYGLPAGMLGGSQGHPLFLGSSSHYFPTTRSQLGESRYMHPDLLGASRGCTTAGRPSSSSATTTVTSSSSSSASVNSIGSLPASISPFMMSSSMAGMLPVGFPLSYNPALAGLYPGSLLPGSAATTAPNGTGFLPQYPPPPSSNTSLTPPAPSSLSTRSEGHRESALVNGDSISSFEDEDEDSDDMGRGQ